MKICLITRTSTHYECMGYLLEIFKSDDITIHAKKGKDKFKYLDFFKTIYNFSVIYDNFDTDLLLSYDLSIKITSTDYIIEHKNVVSILHLGKEKSKCKSKYFLSLTPYIKGENIYYTYPVFNPKLDSVFDNMITLVGYNTDNSFDINTQEFIRENPDFTFNLIVWGSKKYNTVKNFKNVKLYHYLDTDKMVKIINKSKFMLCKKNISRTIFCGNLALALSFEKPLIVDTKTKDDYKIPGIEYKSDFTEVGKLNSISDERYCQTIQEIKIFKENTIENNRVIVKDILHTNLFNKMQ